MADNNPEKKATDKAAADRPVEDPKYGVGDKVVATFKALMVLEGEVKEVIQPSSKRTKTITYRIISPTSKIEITVPEGQLQKEEE